MRANPSLGKVVWASGFCPGAGAGTDAWNEFALGRNVRPGGRSIEIRGELVLNDEGIRGLPGTS